MAFPRRVPRRIISPGTVSSCSYASRPSSPETNEGQSIKRWVRCGTNHRQINSICTLDLKLQKHNWEKGLCLIFSVRLTDGRPSWGGGISFQFNWVLIFIPYSPVAAMDCNVELFSFRAVMICRSEGEIQTEQDFLSINLLLTKCEQGFNGNMAKLFISRITQRYDRPDTLYCLQTETTNTHTHNCTGTLHNLTNTAVKIH